MLDWFGAVILLGSLLVGAWRGLVFEVLSVLGWVAAFVLAQWFAADMAALLPLGSSPEPVRLVVGFAVVFIGTAFASGIVATLVKKMIEAVGLRLVDRALGSLFGLVRGVILLLALAVVIGMTSMSSAPWWQESVLAGVLGSALKGLQPLLPGQLGQYLH